METQMHWIAPGEDFSPCRRIRIAVFCDEQGYRVEDEFDAEDAAAHHLLLTLDGEPVATGRILPVSEGVWRLGRIAVSRVLRGTGLGRVLVEEMRQKAQSLGAARFLLDAQCRVVGFYEKCGFVVTGEEHMDGHVPHVGMEWRGEPAERFANIAARKEGVRL